MSTSTSPPPGEPQGQPTPAGAAAPPPGGERHWGAGRVIAVILGALMLLFGLGVLAVAVIAAVGSHALRDDSGFIMTPTTTVSSAGSAVVSDSLRISNDPSATRLPHELLGRAKVRADAPAGRTVFVGVAHSREAAAYLSGVARSVLLDPASPGFTGDRPTYRYLTGGLPQQPPTSKGIWVASAVGTGRQNITWPVQSGSWTVVVMNPDGSRHVAADVAVGATVPAAGWVIGGMFVLAGILLIGAVLLLVVGLRRPKSAPATPGPPPAQA